MKKNIRNITLLSVLISPVVLAEVYTLNKNETVSGLLYDRLKISPIYKGGYLKKVLEYNNLSLGATNSLPVGTEIRLPPEIETTIVESTPEYLPKEVPAEPEVASSAKKLFYIGARPTVEILKGVIEPSEFSSVFFYPQAHVGFIYESANYLQVLEGSIAYVTFKRDEFLEGNNNLLNGGLFYQILQKHSPFYYGFKINAENSTLVITSENQANYSIKNPLIFSLGPSFQWQSSKYINELNVLYAPTQKVDGNNDLKSSLGLQASGHRAMGKDAQIGVVGGYSHNQVEHTVIHKASLGISVRWHF